MKVGNIMAENSLASLAAAITPNASASADFSQCMQQSMSRQNVTSVKPETMQVKDGTVVEKDMVSDAAAVSGQDSRPAMDVSSTEEGYTEVSLSPEQKQEIDQQITDAVCEVLGMEEETLETFLAELGMVPADLLQIENLQQFVLAINGGQEATDLLFNEKMMSDFTMLSDILQSMDLSEITGLPMDQIVQQMQPMADVSMEMPVSSGDVVSFDGVISSDDVVSSGDVASSGDMVSSGDVIPSGDVVPEVTADDMPEAEIVEQPQETEAATVVNQEMQNAEGSTAVEQEVFRNGRGLIATQNENLKSFGFNPVIAEEAVQNTEAEAEDAPLLMVSKETTGTTGNGAGEQQFFAAQDGFSGAAAQAQEQPVEVLIAEHPFQQTLTGGLREAVMPQQPLTPQMIQIVEQIVEQIRIHVQPDTSSMEMQLNPESLGRVLLTVSAKAGVMTANFTVQTEEARVALESQMYTLKENLEQKELKVEAVEVTVSAFDFSRSGSGEGDQKNLDQGDGRSRRFRMEEQDGEEAEELTAEEEAERVRKSVMRDNGSSIDFTA